MKSPFEILHLAFNISKSAENVIPYKNHERAKIKGESA